MAEDTAVAATFTYRHQAEFARETLRAAGIESVVIVDDAGGAYAGLSLSGPVRLIVHNTDLRQAKTVLEDAGDHEDGPDTDTAANG